jgi:predicted phosphoadenosine phosphosulfate sulfurtransferase
MPRPSQGVSGIGGVNAFGSRKQLAKRVVVEENVYELARQRMVDIFDRFDTVSVSFSGGKDSTACLHLAYEEAARRGRLPLDVVFFDEEAIPYQTEEYVRRVSQWPGISLRWFCLPVEHRNACSRESPYWYPWAPEAADKWVRPLPPEAITTLAGFDHLTPANRMSIPDMCGLLYDPAIHGNVGMILGIRAQESFYRLRALLKKRHDNYFMMALGPTAKGNLWKVYPIYDWKTEDVWTAPDKFGWDYNRGYDVLEQLGVPQSMQRCSPAYGEEPLQKLWTYHAAFPEIWDRMATRVPGANTAAKYALTELYSYGSTLEKPAEWTWEEFLLHWVKKFEPEARKVVAANLRKYITEHYKKTSDPIVEEARHPRTGVSWKYLTMIAMRGDFKRRRRPQLIALEDVPAATEVYQAELYRLRAAGHASLPEGQTPTGTVARPRPVPARSRHAGEVASSEVATRAATPAD